MDEALKKGEQVVMDGKLYTVVWDSNDMTPAERRESARRTASLMLARGIEPVTPELREAAGLPTSAGWPFDPACTPESATVPPQHAR